jgi:hypothetical protein
MVNGKNMEHPTKMDDDWGYIYNYITGWWFGT